MLEKNILLELIKFYSKPKVTTKGRPAKLDNSKILDYIFYVNKTGISWNNLDAPITGERIRQIYNKWCKLDIFKNGWKILVSIYDSLNFDFEDLYIDASHIKNVLGVEEIGPNHYHRFFNYTKLSIIVDDNGCPIGIDIAASNKHDISLLQSTLDSINFTIDSTSNLIADKAYISRAINENLMRKFGVKLITPPRNYVRRTANQNPINNTYDENKLKKRFVVERSFAWLKSYKRIKSRYDKKISPFKGFIYLAACDIISKKILFKYNFENE